MKNLLKKCVHLHLKFKTVEKANKAFLYLEMGHELDILPKLELSCEGKTLVVSWSGAKEKNPKNKSPVFDSDKEFQEGYDDGYEVRPMNKCSMDYIAGYERGKTVKAQIRALCD